MNKFQTNADIFTGSLKETRLGIIREIIGAGTYNDLLIKNREYLWTSEMYIKVWNEIFLAAKDVLDEN